MVKTSKAMDAKTALTSVKHIGTSPSYVNKIVRSKEQIMNKTFLAMMEDPGYDVELHYVKKEE